jgi:endonuclease-3
MDKCRNRRSVPPFRRRQSGAARRIAAHQSVYLAGGGRALGAGDRCGVNKATPALFKLADTPEKMVKLGETRVRELIKTIGLFRTKAKNVVALSRKLVAEHGGQVPHDREALEALPGVGRKTANVVLNIAFGEPTIAVDTHIFRVGNRTGLAVGKTPLDVEMKLMEVVPERYRLYAHHWLILHGRYTCVARRPLCEKCLIADLCKWPGKTVLSAPV